MKTFLYKREENCTKILEIDKKEAIQFIKENRNNNYQLGMFIGEDFDTVIRVYGEYSPFYKVKSVEEFFWKLII